MTPERQLIYVQETFDQFRRAGLGDHKARDALMEHLIDGHGLPDVEAFELINEALGPSNPYPGEWAARQTDPVDYMRFARTTKAKEREMNLPKGVHFVFGFPHARKRKPGRGESEVQSVRFDKDTWTKAKAKSWLKQHDFRHGKIE